MAHLSRRRFLMISAGLAATALPARAEVQAWRGTALGAEARIYLDHPEAEAIVQDVWAEVSRLEGVFSLFRTDSALAVLNRNGRLDAPPFELLECLALAGRVHGASGGLFDPTVQVLWDLYARKISAGGAPDAGELAEALGRTGWAGVSYDEGAVTLRPGMALTLNGVAQGFIADKVSTLLTQAGLRNVLVNTGEFSALGPMPDGAAWPVALTSGGNVPLEAGGLASSSALGTTFDDAGRIGHILNPLTGLPALPRWQLVTVTAQSAGLADAISTAACLMSSRAEIEALCAAFPGAELAALS